MVGLPDYGENQMQLAQSPNNPGSIGTNPVPLIKNDRFVFVDQYTVF